MRVSFRREQRRFRRRKILLTARKGKKKRHLERCLRPPIRPRAFCSPRLGRPHRRAGPSSRHRGSIGPRPQMADGGRSCCSRGSLWSASSSASALATAASAASACGRGMSSRKRRPRSPLRPRFRCPDGATRRAVTLTRFFSTSVRKERREERDREEGRRQELFFY